METIFFNGELDVVGEEGIKNMVEFSTRAKNGGATDRDDEDKRKTSLYGIGKWKSLSYVQLFATPWTI